MPGAAHYELEVHSVGNDVFEGLDVTDLTTTAYTAEDPLTARMDQLYHFRVRSANGGGALTVSGDFTVATIVAPSAMKAIRPQS